MESFSAIYVYISEYIHVMRVDKVQVFTSFYSDEPQKNGELFVPSEIYVPLESCFRTLQNKKHFDVFFFLEPRWLSKFSLKLIIRESERF